MGPVGASVTLRNLTSDVQALTSNVYLVEGPTPALIDAGSQFDLVERLRRDGSTATPEVVLITHTHADHVDNVDDLRSAFDVETLGYDASSHYVDRGLEDGTTIRLGKYVFEVWHTPGHAPDHLCLYAPEVGLLVSGDLVFAGGGIGRTDLPGADPATLRVSIERVAERVGDELSAIYPGHGPVVTDEASGHLAAAARAAGLD